MTLSRQLLVQLVADCAVHSWDLATAIGVDPGLEPPASPLPEGPRFLRADRGAAGIHRERTYR
jgi:hypothetical protein